MYHYRRENPLSLAIEIRYIMKSPLLNFSHTALFPAKTEAEDASNVLHREFSKC